MSTARIIKGIVGGMVTAEGAIHHSKPYFDEDIYSTMMSGRRTHVMQDPNNFKDILDRNGAASIRLYPSGYYGLQGGDMSATSDRFVPIRGIIEEMPAIQISTRWVTPDSLNTVDKVVSNAMENFSVNLGSTSIKPSDAYNMWSSEATRAGANMGGYYKTKKFYQGTSPLQLSVTMKVVDWNGTGQPAATAAALMQYVVPYTNNPNEFNDNKEQIMGLVKQMVAGAKEVVAAGVEQIKDTGSAVVAIAEPIAEAVAPKLGEAGEAVKDGLGGVAEGVVTTLEKVSPEAAKLLVETGENAGRAIEGLKTGGEAAVQLGAMAYNKTAGGIKGEVLSQSLINETAENLADAMTMRFSPPTVDVMIGEYYQHNDMVITSISLKFSKKMTSAGPLWLEATLSLETRKAVDSYKYTGFMLGLEDTARANLKQAYNSDDGSSDSSYLSASGNK